MAPHESDDPILKLRTPEGAEQFAENVAARSPELANRARRRAIELRAEAKGATSLVEQACLEAIFAYERARSHAEKRKFHARRTWMMVKNRGLLQAVDALVSKPTSPEGYTSLAALGLEDLSFEAVVLRHPEHFSELAVKRSRERLRSA